MASPSDGGPVARCGSQRSAVQTQSDAKKNLIQQAGPAITNLKQWLVSAASVLTQPLSRWTLKRILKQAGFRWKRVRKSLKDQQDAVLMAFFKDELDALQQAHHRAELSLWYYDETGLGLNPTGLYAWQSRHHTVHLPAQRGQGFTIAGVLTP